MEMGLGSELCGDTASGFERVADAFLDNFDPKHTCPEIGASLTVVHQGEIVVDLWGGHADRHLSEPWHRSTIVNTYSTTKGLTAACTSVLESRGQLDYQAPVSDYWPEFSGEGKETITVETLLSHQAGLSGVRPPLTLDDLFEWPAIISILEDAEPLWEPGTMAGYHAWTWGFLVGELIKKITGQSVGDFFQTDIAQPLQADFFIGVPVDQDHRVAEMIAPCGEPNQTQAELGEIQLLTLTNPLIEPEVPNRRDFRAAELPAMNGTGNGNGIARIYAPFACGGSFDGVRLLTSDAIARASAIRFSGVDINLGSDFSWSAGFARNGSKGWYGPDAGAFGHSGWGGSMGFADPVNQLSLGYAPNQMDADLNGDPRGIRLVSAVYDCLKAL